MYFGPKANTNFSRISRQFENRQQLVFVRQYIAVSNRMLLKASASRNRHLHRLGLDAHQVADRLQTKAKRIVKMRVEHPTIIPTRTCCLTSSWNWLAVIQRLCGNNVRYDAVHHKTLTLYRIHGSFHLDDD